MGYREPIFTGTLRDAQRRLYGEPQTIAGSLRRAPVASTPPPDPERPYLYGRGPVEASTCLALLPSPPCCWDVNGYYRALGVHWKATTTELRKAYQRLDGQSSAWLTYVFKQLLTKKVRQEYDRCSIGEVYLDDYVLDAIRREAVRRASAKNAAGQHTTPEDELADLGYVVQDEEKDWWFEDGPPPEVVDDEPDEVQSPPGPPAWEYAFYRWRSNCTDTDRLREWQELLVGALGRRGENIKIAVGYHGRTAHPWVVGTVGFRTVVFLNDREQPTAEMARAASDRVVEDLHGKGREAALPHRDETPA